MKNNDITHMYRWIRSEWQRLHMIIHSSPINSTSLIEETSYSCKSSNEIFINNAFYTRKISLKLLFFNILYLIYCNVCNAINSKIILLKFHHLWEFVHVFIFENESINNQRCKNFYICFEMPTWKYILSFKLYVNILIYYSTLHFIYITITHYFLKFNLEKYLIEKVKYRCFLSKC